MFQILSNLFLNPTAVVVVEVVAVFAAVVVVFI